MTDLVKCLWLLKLLADRFLEKVFMSKAFLCLKRYSEMVSHWATTLTFFAAVIGGFFAYKQLGVTNAQLLQANEQRKWQNYNDMNVRYAELYKCMPKEVASGNVQKGFSNLDPEIKGWVRQYFDLYSEEYWLYEEGLIPKEMWTHRIYKGVRVNLSKYPALIDGILLLEK